MAGSPNPAFGNPIYPLIGNKRQSQSFDIGIGKEVLGAIYDTTPKAPVNDPALVLGYQPSPSFGELWHSTLHRKLIFAFDYVGAPLAVQASRGGGVWISFTRDDAGQLVPDSDVGDRVSPIPGGWRYINNQRLSEEIYDTDGILRSVKYATGYLFTPSRAKAEPWSRAKRCECG